MSTATEHEQYPTNLFSDEDESLNDCIINSEAFSAINQQFPFNHQFPVLEKKPSGCSLAVNPSSPQSFTDFGCQILI